MAEGAKSRRLFAGIELDERTRSECAEAAERLRKTGFEARFEGADKLHVTLAFLGNVEASRFDEIATALSTAAARVPEFALCFDKLGAFPHERKPRVVYVGAREQGAAYRALAAAIRQAYAELGFAFESDAVAHVTIARVKEPKRPLPLVEFSPIELDVRGVALFESIFEKQRNTTRYEIVADAALQSTRTLRHARFALLRVTRGASAD